MPNLHCPSCAAPFDGEHPDPIARCRWCGALTSAAFDASRVSARLRIDADRARAAVRDALPGTASPWEAGRAHLVFYPFADAGTPRRPYRPLAGLPTVIQRAWRPSGADLRLASETASRDAEGLHVPPSLAPPAGTRVVHYPFWRVSLRSRTGESAAWCDGIDAQVMLPYVLAAEPSPAALGEDGVSRTAVLVAGAIAGLAAPLPASLIPLSVAYLVFGRARSGRSS